MLRILRVVAALSMASLFASAAFAQPVNRIKGRVLDTDRKPVTDADIRIEALAGFGATDYVGQRTFTTTTNAKGEWSMTGLKAGIWVFDVSAPGKLPTAVALPINLVTAIGSGASGLMLPWELVLTVRPVPEGPYSTILIDSAAAARAANADGVRVRLTSYPEGVDGVWFDDAGAVALMARDGGLARALFARGLERDPASFAAALGVASSALVLHDFDAASRSYAAARDRTPDKDVQKYLTAAIKDLQQIRVPTK